MLTVKTVTNQMTDAKRIMQALRDALRTIDPMFQEEENKFNQASACLVQELEELGCVKAEEYLLAKEEALSMELIFIGWQGFQLNLEIFKNPVTALMLRQDYEELHLERRLCVLPTTRRAQEKQQPFCELLDVLPEDKKDLAQIVEEYYSYLQTTGYKIAHYFGFCLADRFLPYVLTGYVSDPVNTTHYLNALENYLQMDLKQLG